ncbi:glycosyltransferase family 2 protein [Paenibacillus sp. N3.4]|uniref:glycosyltransferase family 2 protein n=1 Tax=Paenibacillus sp. N3.4 TaxID=2603222 RepID=UPI0011C93730|nr:glycosyltransferase family 2 protein [Paenibacillus sp. N3.4]TXK77950.1 glycosyltransferase family 2 protein [Paenibacillus sp. N3.4]
MNIEKNLKIECNKLINSVIRYCEINNSNLNYKNIFNLISDLINKEYLGNEYLEELREVIDGYLYGRISESVLSFYLNKQFMIEIEKIDELLACLNNVSIHYTNSSSMIQKFSDNFSYPKVSVLITTFNRRRYLLEAINSFLHQDYPNIEIIVVDDCSNDGTKQMMIEMFESENRVIYMQNEINLGPGTNRLRAYSKYADGDYVIFFDDDDYLIDMNYISKAIQFHIKHPDVAFVGAGTFYEYKKNNYLKLSFINLRGVINRQEYFLKFMSNEFPKPCITTTVFKNKCLIEMNILEMEMVNDTPIFLRSLLVGDAGFIDIVAAVYRVHGGNITFNCSFDFIIENLKEKMEIKKMATTQYDSKQIENWWNHNAYITISYYLFHSAKDSRDFKNMYAWTQENCPDIYKRLFREFRWHLIKRKFTKMYNTFYSIPIKRIKRRK